MTKNKNVTITDKDLELAPLPSVIHDIMDLDEPLSDNQKQYIRYYVDNAEAHYKHTWENYKFVPPTDEERERDYQERRAELDAQVDYNKAYNNAVKGV